MNVENTPIEGIKVAGTNKLKDERGFFSRLFCNKDLSVVLENRKIIQINHSCTRAVGAVRGLHYQNYPHAEMKMVRCLRGKVWDVGVDIRHGSPTFLKYFGVELSPNNAKMVIYPEGVAHGFQCLEPNSELLYLHTAAYEKEAEGALRYDDPIIGITWPLTVTYVSPRDLSHQLLTNEFTGV